MPLETVMYQFQQELLGYGCMDIYQPWIHGFNSLEREEACNHETLDIPTCGSALNSNLWGTNSSCRENMPVEQYLPPAEVVPVPTTTGRRKRQRSRSVKNQEEVEHQRMTHITVERNRRKQMNDYLSVLRSMMPPSYVQRGDQASIVGGAINFVKELEQLLQSLEARKIINERYSTDMEFPSSLFSGFFTFPQYSSRSTNTDDENHDQSLDKKQPTTAIKADVEVTMVESHANLKVLLRRQPKQLLRMVDGLYSLCLSILHINITTVDHMALYSFSVKAEEECQLTSVNEIAAAVYEMVDGMQEEDYCF